MSVVPKEFEGIPEQLDEANVVLTGPSEKPLNVISKFVAEVQWKSNVSRQVVYVVHPLRFALLGPPAIEALNGL